MLSSKENHGIIPAAFIAAADSVMDEASAKLAGISIDQAMSQHRLIRDIYRDLIAKALAAERLRCWKIANQYACDHGMRHEHDNDGATVDEACGNICKEIRPGTYPFKPLPTAPKSEAA